MGSFSLPHILILAIVAILLLGGGRFSSMMGDVAKGIKSFKKGMTEDDDVAATPTDGPKKLEGKPPEVHPSGSTTPTGSKVG